MVNFLKGETEDPINIFVPPQLHIMTGIAGTFFGFLMVICSALALLWLRKAGVRKEYRNGHYCFTGNNARKLLKSVPILRELIAPYKGSMTDVQMRALSLLCACLESANVVVHRTMGPTLHAEWEQSLDDFSRSYKTFIAAYEKLKPPSRGRETMSLKMRMLQVEMREYIKKHHESTSSDSEQPFEHAHLKIGQFFKSYAFPNWDTDANGFKNKNDPCRCQNQCCKTLEKERKRAQKDKTTKTTWKEAPEALVKKHRLLHLRAVTAYNSRRHPDTDAVFERALKVVDVLEGKIIPELDDPGFSKMF